MIIQSKKVFIDDQFKQAQIEIDGKIIKGIYPYQAKNVDIDYNDLMILPGFYDVHCHGWGGYDTNQAQQDGLKRWLENIPSEGVCGICPTTITQSHQILENALKCVADTSKQQYNGARILGIHLEGPYISKDFCGAQPVEYIVKPDIEEFKQYQNAAEGLIKIVTLAPEEDEGFALTKYLIENNVNVSLGHSGADYSTSMAAVQLGAKSFTHTYNGMSRFNHRDNNMVGAALTADCFAEIICDCHHSTEASLKIFFKCKGKNGIMMSDGLMTKGLPIGTETLFGGQLMKVIEDGTCRLVSTGNFAGSTMKINEGLKNLVTRVNVPFEVAVSSCTSAPCRYLGIDDHKGYIKENYDCDIAILDDDYNVKATYVEGRLFDYE